MYINGTPFALLMFNIILGANKLFEVESRDSIYTCIKGFQCVVIQVTFEKRLSKLWGHIDLNVRNRCYS